MIIETKVSAKDMSFEVFRTRLSTLVSAINASGSSAKVLFAGPGEEKTDAHKHKLQIWKAKIEVTGGISPEQLGELKSNILDNPNIGAKQGLPRVKKLLKD